MSLMTKDRADSWDAVKRAHVLDGDAEQLKQYYRQWAASYDNDVRDQGYVGPNFLVDFLQSLHRVQGLAVDVRDPGLTILDAGCGTGLVGVVLRERGYTTIDGFDLSKEMADVAMQTGAFRSVQGGIDMCQPLDVYEDEQYEAILCCGVFTLGHVPPSAMRELARITRRGGVVAVTTRKSYFEESNFGSECRKIVDEGLMTLVHKVFDGPYIDEEGAHYWAFRRT